MRLKMARPPMVECGLCNTCKGAPGTMLHRYECLPNIPTDKNGKTHWNNILKRFKSNLQTLRLAGGGHMLCSVKIMERARENPTPEEITAAEEKIMSMSLLKL